MKKFSIKLNYESGEVRETWIEAENEAEAGQKFFRRKDGSRHLGEGKVEIEITEANDEPGIDHYTREVLIELCEDGMSEQYYDTRTAYIPTRLRLERSNEGDWY